MYTKLINTSKIEDLVILKKGEIVKLNHYNNEYPAIFAGRRLGKYYVFIAQAQNMSGQPFNSIRKFYFSKRKEWSVRDIDPDGESCTQSKIYPELWFDGVNRQLEYEEDLRLLNEAGLWLD